MKFNNNNIEIDYKYEFDSRELAGISDLPSSFELNSENEDYTEVGYIVRFSGVDDSGTEVMMTAGTPVSRSLSDYILTHKAKRTIEKHSDRCIIRIAISSGVTVGGNKIPASAFSEARFRRALAEKEKANAYVSGTQVLNWKAELRQLINQIPTPVNTNVWTINEVGY